MVAISKSGIQPTEEDNQQIQKLAGAVFQGSDEADAP
jgi:hypothetical protein